VLPILRQRGSWQPPVPDAANGTINDVPFAPTSGPVERIAAS